MKQGKKKPIKSPKKGSVDAFMVKYGLSRQSVYNEINSGDLETIKVGRRRIIPEAAEQNWLKAKGLSHA